MFCIIILSKILADRYFSFQEVINRINRIHDVVRELMTQQCGRMLGRVVVLLVILQVARLSAQQSTCYPKEQRIECGKQCRL